MQNIWSLLRRNPKKEVARDNFVRFGTVFELFQKTRKWFDIINRVELSIFSNSQPIEKIRNNPFARVESSYPQIPHTPQDIKKDHINVLA